ncbi:MAG: hypothetical protein FJ253_10310, partial [Phycisphaerae bacterium]|nr:hypothetical protein [Phycisphaerae bacterium]
MAVAGAVSASLLLGGCEREFRRETKLMVPDSLPPGTGVGARSDSFLRVSLEPLGEIPNDAFTLPLVSPDGRFIAVQVESNADWPTLTASPNQAKKVVGRIAWYEVVSGTLLPRGDRVGPLMLGRSADSTGFLVESPAPDGSRAIGRMPWSGGEIEWLVRDDAVNAFAVLGPRGELAWSRRPVASRFFELMIDRPEGRVSFTASADHSWLCPRFDGAGNLFAWRLHDGTLAAGFLPLMQGREEDLDSLLPALRLRPVTLRGSAERAFLAMTPADG